MQNSILFGSSRQPQTRKPRQLSTQVLLPATSYCPMVLARILEDGKPIGDYWFHAIPSDFGIAYRLDKDGVSPSEDSGYNVCVENEQDGHCHCLGFERWGPCKHLFAVKDLLDKGALPLPGAPVAAQEPCESYDPAAFPF